MREADRVRLGEVLEAGGHIDPIAEHIASALDDVAQMDATADMKLLGGVVLGVIGMELALNALGTLHSMHDRGKVHEEGITHHFDDVPLIFRDGVLDDLVMQVEQP
jgi:hypothetical protein